MYIAEGIERFKSENPLERILTGFQEVTMKHTERETEVGEKNHTLFRFCAIFMPKLQNEVSDVYWM